ncbi:Secretory carrier-associated membrane protein 4 [Vitis vinifera]|uniref:Secretory carrier-associated membrane protein n=1 Tax=Vitis vinifera TaxID=29760 RepID=A0A438GQ72_VITVI|nr:Secretory carrier-associated membrane protein 4 [Vitis vinifera]
MQYAFDIHWWGHGSEEIPNLKVATAPGSRSRVPPAASANLGFNDKYDATVDIPLDTLNDSNKKEKELAAWEADLKRKEKDIKRREDAVSKKGIPTEDKNWPSFFPIIHNDIANEIPVDAQRLQYLAFASWLGFSSFSLSQHGIRVKGENLILSCFLCHQLRKPFGDRVSFRSPSPSPNTFLLVGSSLENTHRWRTFPATSFSNTDHTKRSAWRRSPTFPKASEPENRPRAGHAHFYGWRLNLTRRRVRAREAFSGDAPPPPASPDADQHPYLLGSPIRALHVPLLGIFVSVSPPNSLSGEVPTPFSPPQSLHVPWEVFFYLSGGQGYEDHLVTQEADIPKAKGLYTNDIQRLYKVVSAIVHISQQDLDLSTYIGQIASLKEEFLTVMPLTPDVGAQQTQLDKFFMVLTLIGLRPDLEPIRDQILGSSSVPSLDDVFARLLRISFTQTLSSDSTLDSSVLVSQTTSRGGRSGTRVTWKPPRTAHMAQSSDSPLPQPPSSSASQTSQASIASVAQPGNASACLTHTSSLGPWILDSRASDHLSGIGLALPLPFLPLTSILYTPECPFNLISINKITRTLNCSITFSNKFVTLQDRSTGKTIGIGRESQGLYHLTSDSSPAVCISTNAPLLIHNRLGHPSLSKF